MFQFPAFASNPLCVQGSDTLILQLKTQPLPPACRQADRLRPQSLKVGFPIRKSPDQSLFAAPRSLSQRTTSFIASQRQGIHQMPLSHLIALIIDAQQGPGPFAPPSLIVTDPIISAVRPQTRQGPNGPFQDLSITRDMPNRHRCGQTPAGHPLPFSPRHALKGGP
jgi:hypothetical protein